MKINFLLSIIVSLIICSCDKRPEKQPEQQINDTVNIQEVIDDLEMGVSNGGFNGYFFNSAGDNAHEALTILRAIGAQNTTKILEEAIAKFPNSKVPKNRDARQELLEKIDPDNEIFNELNQRFWNLEENLQDLLNKK